MFSGDTFKRFLRTLGAAPTTSGQLGGITTANFFNGTIVPGGWANTVSFSLPAGTFIIIMRPSFEPGLSSNATFSNITFVVSTLANNGGTNFYSFNDTKVRQSYSYGNGSTYDAIYNMGIITLTAAQGSLVASAQMNYAVAGANNNGAINGGTVNFYRIG